MYFSTRKCIGFLTVLLTTLQATSTFEGQVSFRVDSSKPGSIINDEFSTFAKNALAEQSVHGLSLGIVRPDGGVEFGAWGIKTEDGNAVDEDTIFAIGSCTKAFLSASLGILMDDFEHGRNVSALPHPLATFNWHTKIKDLLPYEWQLADKWAEEKVDLRDILSHVSGQVANDFSYKGNESLHDVVLRLRHHETPFELRQTFAYNNEMYMVGTHILATYSGVSFSEFAHERIFKPLGMSATTLSPEVAEATGNFSHGWSSKGRRIPFWFSKEGSHVISGAGAMLSSAKDMTKWMQLLLNGGVDPRSNATIIPRSAFEAVTTASAIMFGTGIPAERSLMGYGMGWMRTSYRGQEVITHGGGLPGFQSLVEFLPYAKLGLVSFTNTDGGVVVNNAIRARVISDVLGSSLLNISFSEDEISPSKSAKDVSYKATSLSTPLELYAGTYYRPDYGNITLCASTADKSNITTNNAGIDYCSSLREQFAIIDNSKGEHDFRLQLIGEYDCLLTKQVRLTHLESDVFSFAASTLFPHGFGADKRPFEYSLVGGDAVDVTARFIVKDNDGTRGKTERQVVEGFFACGIMRGTEEVQGDCMTGEGAQPGSLLWFEKLA